MAFIENSSSNRFRRTFPKTPPDPPVVWPRAECAVYDPTEAVSAA